MTEMEIETIANRIKDNLQNDNSLFKHLENSLSKQLQKHRFTNEQLGQVLSQFYITALQVLPGLEYKIAVELTQVQAQTTGQEAEAALTEEKKNLVAAQVLTEAEAKEVQIQQGKFIHRQRVGYDDNIQVKAAEYSGSLANFAINAANDNMEARVADFKDEIIGLKDRACTSFCPPELNT